MDILKDYLPETVAGKNILITGATTGIGRATALLLSRLGAHVIVAGLDNQHMKDLLSDLKEVAEGDVYEVLSDLSTEKGIQALFKAVDKHFDKLDVLINNAALPFGNVEEGSYQEWQRVINTNVLAYVAGSAEAVKRMSAVKSGHIVNIGSMSADVREESGTVYVSTKSAIQGFSESLRKEVNKLGIKVSLIEPGAVDTDMQPFSTAVKKQKVKKMEMLAADDIAFSILYCLCQPLRSAVVELKIRPQLQII